MKKLVSIIIFCLGCMGILGAQNVWKTLNCNGQLLGAASNGDLFAAAGYTGLIRSQNEGETWEQVNSYYMQVFMAFSPNGRLFIFPSDYTFVCYSDDHGDTWQQTATHSLLNYYMTGAYAVNNDTLLLWGENHLHYTLDAGATWHDADMSFMDENLNISDVIANEAGDVYAGIWQYSGYLSGIYHSTLSDMQNWELAAFDGAAIFDLEFDPEGNVVASYFWTGPGFSQEPGFYLFGSTSFGISNNGIIYNWNPTANNTATLTYSFDHGEHFTEIGEGLPLSEPAPGGQDGTLTKGFDNHLYFYGNGQYHKSISDADHIREDYPYDNMRWAIYYRNLYLDWAPYIQIGIKGDTIVDGTTYHKVIKCTSFGTVIDGDCFGGIRVETDGKWYFRLFSEENVPQYLYLDMEPNTERLIYDFSLSVCDGFEYEGQYWMSVFDIDEIGINGSMRNRFWFDSNCEEGDHPHDWNWIEGIGSNYGLLYAIQAFPLDGSAYHLGEVYQDGELIYSDPYFHDYVPMIKEGNQRQKWNVVYMASMNYPNDYFTEIQSIRDNITLDGVDYKLVWKEDVYDSKRIAGAVREDDKRVYFRRYWQQSYQDEVLLYDFNLTVGDTVTVNYFEKLIVLEESQVLVQGIMRKQLGLAMYFDNGTTGEIEEYWIEGVGSTYGFLNSGYEGWVGAFVHLLCYHENGDLVWDNEAFDDCVMNSEGTPASFAPQGAEWYFDVFNPWGTHPEYQRFFVEGDTVIQGHQCSIIDQRFVDTGHDGGEYVYEEDNKVYWFNPTTNAFTTLYDFDAEAGESWDYEVGECTHQVIVDSVGSATWNGHTYRTQWVRYYEENLPIYYSGKIMEGIGYERGLFPSVYVCNGWEIFDASEIEYLRCYVNDGEMLYHEGGYDCEQTTVTPPSHPEWYYEILNDDGTITYQYMYQAGDTIIQDEPTQILVKINTLYDKGMREEVTHEYVFELNGKLYWWNKRTHSFTVLYDYEAEVGDSWNIMVGIEPPLTMTVDAVDYVEYEGRTYRVMHVSDPDDLFSGDIVCGIGHLTSFFPERLMRNSDGFRVEGLRCYWVEDELVFNLDGEEECDAIYSEVHGIEEDGPSTPSTGLAVYPNPTNGVLFVETRRATSLPDQTYRITNLMGQTVLSGNINADNQQINVSSLPQGMYFITFAGETQKFVVR